MLRIQGLQILMRFLLSQTGSLVRPSGWLGRAPSFKPYYDPKPYIPEIGLRNVINFPQKDIMKASQKIPESPHQTLYHTNLISVKLGI
jgi:hypothetical protein